jgi:hypothetical protein
MNLGLDQLTDSQLLELLQQAWVEVATRSAIVQNLALEDNRSMAEKVNEFKRLYESNVEEQRGLARLNLNMAITAEIAKEVLSGDLRLLSPEEEAKIVAVADTAARLKLIEKLQEELRNGNVALSLTVSGPVVTVKHSGATNEYRHSLSPRQIEAIAGSLRVLLDAHS